MRSRVTINAGYLMQQGIVLALAAAAGLPLAIVLGRIPWLRRRAAVAAACELLLVAGCLFAVGLTSERLGWAQLLPPRARRWFLAIGLSFYWIALLWPLRVWLARRRLRGRAGAAVRLAALGAVSISAWATLGEPWLLLDAERRTLRFPEVASRPIRIAHLTDLQLVGLGPREERVVREVNAFAPHLVVLTGDYVCAFTGGETAIAAARSVLSRLRASHGIYATTSDSDTFAQQRAVFAGLGVHLLLNRSVRVDVEGIPVRIGGVNHYAPRFGRIRRGACTEELFVVACHRPDLAPLCEERMPEMDLFLTGHTHGGQLRLPWVGPILKFSPVPREVAAGGVFLRPGYVLALSRGIGMEGNYAPRFRLNCSPHVFLFTLEHGPSVATGPAKNRPRR